MAKKKNFNFVGWLIIILMISSVFGVMFYGFSNPQGSYKYNGHTLKVVENNYVTEIDGKQLTFYFLPENVENLNFSEDIKAKLSSPILTILFDPEDENIEYMDLLRFELIELSSSEAIKTYFLPAMTKESDIYNLPIMSCDDATATQPTLYFLTGNSTKIYQDNNCIIFQGTYGTDIVRLRDRLLYQLSGIM